MSRFRQFWILISIMALLAASVSSVSGECAVCKKAKQSEQNVWEQEAQSFLSGESLNDASSKTEASSNNSGSPGNTESPANSGSPGNTESPANSGSPSSTESPANNGSPSNTQSPANNGSPAKTEAPPLIEAPHAKSIASSAKLLPLSDAGSAEILLDVDEDPKEYIPGAIHIPYTSIWNDGELLKPVPDLVKVLGDAGISDRNDVAIYGKCSCQAGETIATYVYWVMKYLGHEKVELLDGNIDDWVARKLPTITQPKVLPKTTYVSHLNSTLLASYDYVKSDMAQVVDSRTAKEFEIDSIPKAINIPYERLMHNGELNDEAALREAFKDLDKHQPVVVYSDTGVMATVAWFALGMLGYDARLYSWEDWTAHQPSVFLKDIHAEPNPAKTGDIVRITATFSSGGAEKPTGSNASGETVLSVMQCTVCGGFGSPQGFALLTQENNSTGAVKIGSAPKSLPQGASNGGTAGMSCTATITDSSGKSAGKAILKRVTDDEFSGIWNANIGVGVYEVTLTLSMPSGTKTFKNALELEVQGSTSKYKNLEK
jgi:thiosulfate/3-mercaptopyruvate sulfurtransferase